MMYRHNSQNIQSTDESVAARVEYIEQLGIYNRYIPILGVKLH